MLLLHYSNQEREMVDTLDYLHNVDLSLGFGPWSMTSWVFDIEELLVLGVFWLIMCYVGQRFLVVHQEQEYLSDSSCMRGIDISEIYLIPTNSGQQALCDASV